MEHKSPLDHSKRSVDGIIQWHILRRLAACVVDKAIPKEAFRDRAALGLWLVCRCTIFVPR